MSKKVFVRKSICQKKLGAGILTRVAGSSCAGVADGQDSASKLWPLTATAGVSTVHITFAGRTGVLQGRCFHSYDDKCAMKAEERAESG